MAGDEEISDHLDSDLSDLESDTFTSESSCKKIHETFSPKGTLNAYTFAFML